MAGPYAPSALENYLGLGKQASKGTAVAPAVFVPYMGQVDLNHGMAGDEIREGGTSMYVNRNLKTADDPQGGSALAARISTFSKIAAYFLGTDTISGIAVPYTHTMTPNPAANIWLSVEQNLADEYIDRFADCVIRRIRLTGEDARDLMMAFEWFGLTKARQSAATAETYETATPLKQDDATFTVDGSSVTNIRRWELDLAWTYDEGVRLSKVTRGYAPKLALTGQLTLRDFALSDGLYRKINYGSSTGTAGDQAFYRTAASAFAATYNNGEASTDEREIAIAVPCIDWISCNYTPLNPGANEGTYHEITGRLAKVAGSELVTITSKTADSTGYLA